MSSHSEGLIFAHRRATDRASLPTVTGHFWAFTAPPRRCADWDPTDGARLGAGGPRVYRARLGRVHSQPCARRARVVSVLPSSRASRAVSYNSSLGRTRKSCCPGLAPLAHSLCESCDTAITGNCAEKIEVLRRRAHTPRQRKTLPRLNTDSLELSGNFRLFLVAPHVRLLRQTARVRF
jgi:hypothetical protein